MSAKRLHTGVLTFVTGNKMKLAEVQQILGSSVKMEARALDLPELQGADPQSIARDKCARAYELVKGAVLVEDTSLCFNALGGLPGPYIKWFLASVGNDGLHRMLHGFDDKSGYAQCVFAYHPGYEGAEVVLLDGRCDGSIVAPRGPGSDSRSNWDPVFEPSGHTKTFAEMEKSEKNEISHRRRALDKLCEYLKQ